jgi:hypothetical protein
MSAFEVRTVAGLKTFGFAVSITLAGAAEELLGSDAVQRAYLGG